MRGRAGGKELIWNDFQAQAARRDPSTVSLRLPPSPPWGEGFGYNGHTASSRHVPPPASARNPTIARQTLAETDENPTESDMENDVSGPR
jgi:hypothetical protein